jgi:hypothetical protein
VAVADVAQLHLVQLAGRLLSVARDEGDGVAGEEKLQRGPDLRRAQPELRGDAFGVQGKCVSA